MATNCRNWGRHVRYRVLLVGLRAAETSRMVRIFSDRLWETKASEQRLPDQRPGSAHEGICDKQQARPQKPFL